MEEYKCMSNSKQECYQEMIKFLQEHGFKIYGLSKTSRGNSHDENWHTLYTFLSNENPFSEFIEVKKNSKGGPYEDAPTVEFIDELSEDEIKKWSGKYERYSGEENVRNLYAVKNEEEKYIIRVERSYKWDVQQGNTILVASVYPFEYKEFH